MVLHGHRASSQQLTPAVARTTESYAGVRVVRATDASQAARDRAFAAAAAATTYGPLGPFNPPMVILPMDRHARAAPLALTRPSVRPSPAPAAARQALLNIRASRRSIAGYCAVYDTPSVAGDFVVARGAFRDLIASRQSVYLFLNHPAEAGERPSQASTTSGTLHLEEDQHGVWFEAMFRNDAAGIEAYRDVLYGSVTGVSWGGSVSASTTYRGVRTATNLAAWEISLLTAPHRPRFPGTWADVNVAARTRRHLQARGLDATGRPLRAAGGRG